MRVCTDVCPILLLAAVVSGCASTPAPLPYVPPADTSLRMQASLKQHRAAAIAVSVVRDGRIAWTGVYGEAAPGIPADARTLFNVASLAKPVTAEVAMRLVAAGQVSLDEPVSDHWVDPDLATDPRHRQLTPRLLLSHRTGFPNWRFEMPDKKLAFRTEPAGSFTYSGEGYEYLRRFLEKKTGKPFEALAQEQVFTPLGMDSASFSERAWMKGRVVEPMNRAGEFKQPDLAREGNPNAADNLFVTIENYATFMIAVSRQDGLGRSLAAERVSKHVEMPADGPCRVAGTAGCPTVSDFGLGWVLYRFGNTTIASNSGSDWGEFALVYFDPATKDGMLYFANGGNGVQVVMDALQLFDGNSAVAGYGRAQMKK